MAGCTTKPITLDQYVLIAGDLDHNYRTITLLMGKALRINDVLNTITVQDVYFADGRLRESITFNESKTGKRRIVPIEGSMLISALKELWEVSLASRPYADTTNLFYSRKATGRLKNTPINTITVNRQLKAAVERLGLSESIEQLSTHGLRKTAARAMLDAGTAVEVISDVLNHSDTRVTFRYIGINSEDVSKAYKAMEF